MAKASFMGYLYTVNPNVDRSELSGKQQNKYKRLLNHKAPYFLAVHDASGMVLCSPVSEDKIGKAIALPLPGATPYAVCFDLLKAHPSWLIRAEMFEAVNQDTIDLIYNKYEHWKDKVSKRAQQKKKRQNIEDAKYLREIGKVKKHYYPKEKAASSVSWSMAHPMQGGRTSPK